MNVESAENIIQSAHDLIPANFVPIARSNESKGVEFVSISWMGSLSASSEAASLQGRLVNLWRDLHLGPTATSWSDTLDVAIPSSFYVSGFGHRDTQVSLSTVNGQAQVLSHLRDVFEVEPLEDGIEHPAEEIIRQALLDSVDSRVLKWLQEIALDTAQPNLSASVLRCLGRLVRPGTKSWRIGLIRSALGKGDVEIRDAAVQTAESWGGEAVRRVLAAHDEQLPWLRDYIRDVVEDLEK